MIREPARPFNVLLVEDNPGDVGLIKEALKDETTIERLYVMPDGVEALAFLRNEEKFAEAPRPDLILLDLNLPRKNGLDVLREIKVDETLLNIPVVILTSSEAERDVMSAYGLHANCYVKKPFDLENFLFVVRSIKNFWLSIAHLPKGD